MSDTQRIALFDVNNFYASCEVTFRPELRGTSVVVLSSNDGCIVARSAEAKALGLKMGQPWHQVTPDVQKQTSVFSSNFALYGDMSNRVMTILGSNVERQSVYSIDESFLDLSDSPHIDDRARAIRAQVLQWTGLTVCAGIGSTKTRAKLANHIAKSNSQFGGVFNLENLTTGEQRKWFENIPVDEVWGVGPRTHKRLCELNIHTVQDLAAAPLKRIRSDFGVVLQRTVAELNGMCCLPLEMAEPLRQQIRCARSFGQSIETLEGLQQAAVNFVSQVARKLRDQGSETSTLHVFIATNPFRRDERLFMNQATCRLPQPSCDTREMARVVSQAVAHLYRPGYRYKKAGVMAMDMQPAGESRQLSLLSDGCDPKAMGLNAVMDRINDRFGRNTLSVCRSVKPKAWTMKQGCLSPAYTTNVEQLLKVY